MKKVVLIFCLILLTGCSNNEKITYKNISSSEAYNIIESEEDYIVIDVRESDEYLSGHVKNAVNVPLGELENQIDQIVLDKDKLILVYCQSGRRSEEASKVLVDMGYTNVNNFGGLNNWSYDIVSE